MTNKYTNTNTWFPFLLIMTKKYTNTNTWFPFRWIMTKITQIQRGALNTFRHLCGLQEYWGCFRSERLARGVNSNVCIPLDNLVEAMRSLNGNELKLRFYVTKCLSVTKWSKDSEFCRNGNVRQLLHLIQCSGDLIGPTPTMDQQTGASSFVL